MMFMKCLLTQRSTTANDSPGKRESRRISNIVKREISSNKDQVKGCETPQKSQTGKISKGNEQDISTCSSANISRGNSENSRPGAPHYCEICGKVILSINFEAC